MQTATEPWAVSKSRMLPFKRVLLIFTSFHRNNLYRLDWLDLMIAWNLLAALVLFGLSIVLWVREETLSAFDRFGNGALPSMGKIRHQHCFLRRLEHKTSLYNFKGMISSSMLFAALVEAQGTLSVASNDPVGWAAKQLPLLASPRTLHLNALKLHAVACFIGACCQLADFPWMHNGFTSDFRSAHTWNCPYLSQINNFAAERTILLGLLKTEYVAL